MVVPLKGAHRAIFKAVFPNKEQIPAASLALERCKKGALKVVLSIRLEDALWPKFPI